MRTFIRFSGTALAAIAMTTGLLAQTTSEKPAEHKETVPKEWYMTGSGEWIFSMPILDVNGSDKGSVIRFSPVVNLQSMMNYDFSAHFGFFTGLSLRNQGFIYDVPNTDVRYKFRTYNLGVPVGFKIGRMNRSLIFLGYNLELPFNYKEKRFEGGDKKDKFSVWFSDRNEQLYHSVFFGLQGPHGSAIKFTYYLNNFHNTDFTETVDGVEVKPYAGLNANIFAISLSYELFRNGELMGERWKKKGA